MANAESAVLIAPDFKKNSIRCGNMELSLDSNSVVAINATKGQSIPPRQTGDGL